MQQHALDMGVRPESLRVTDPVVNTAAEAVAVARMLPASARVLLVTSAYHMARAKKEFEQAGLGVGPGDEVIGSTLTFVGSISPVIFLGAAVVLVDCDRTSWNMDPDLLARELEEARERGRLPKAVVPTDLYGQCADYDRIFAVCDRFDVPVVVDAAEAMGARYGCQGGVHAGKGAKAAVFSFNGNKIMTTSGGGMLASDDKALIDRARFLSQQARDPFPHYEHTELGFNYRMSNVLAAIGRGQLTVLDDRVQRRREIFAYYRGALEDVPGIEFMPEADFGRSNRWLTVILITPEQFGADTEAVRLALKAENIESRPVWKPMHMQPVFQTTHPCRTVGGSVSEDLFTRGLCLPSGTAMTPEDQDRIIRTILGVRPALL